MSAGSPAGRLKDGDCTLYVRAAMAMRATAAQDSVETDAVAELADTPLNLRCAASMPARTPVSIPIAVRNAVSIAQKAITRSTEVVEARGVNVRQEA